MGTPSPSDKTCMNSLENQLRWKIDLLCNGLEISEKTIEKINKKGISFDLGRKGGAGPAGGRYFILPNGSIVNTPLYRAPSNISRFEITDIESNLHVILKVSNSQAEISKSDQILLDTDIYLLPTPDFYSLHDSQGIPLKKIALLHGNETLATTIHQRCRYWRGDQQCQFCGIELSVNMGATIETKTAPQIIEVIEAAQNENKTFASHLTLTIGTSSTPDKGMATYLATVAKIRSRFPNIGIHIQIEPMKDMSWYKKLKDVGVNTIGIHLEILDDVFRKQICPGKAHISKKTYFNHWKKAVDVYGKNQVSTFILTGLDQSLPILKEELIKIISIGVLPLITPMRYIEGALLPPTKTSVEDFWEIIQFAAKLCIDYEIDPTQNLAGCIRCGGCSPLIDAYLLAKAKLD